MAGNRPRQGLARYLCVYVCLCIFEDYHGPNRAVLRALTVNRQEEIVGVDATCHSLRRLFCTNLYYGVDGEGGCDLATLKDLMRHASVNTTLTCYIDVRDREKDEIMRKFGTSMGRVLNI